MVAQLGPGESFGPLPVSRPTEKLLLLIRGLCWRQRNLGGVFDVWGRGECQCLENPSPGNRYAVLGEPLIVGTGPDFMFPGDAVNFSCRRSHLNFFNCISSTVFLYEKWETSEQ